MNTKKLKQLLILSATILAVGLSRPNAVAQPGPPDGANFDPQKMQQQIQERIMTSLREQLVVTNEEDWKVIEPRLSKVMQVRMESMMGGLGGMRGMMGNRGGGGRGFPGFGQPDPDAEMLQKTLEDKAPIEQLKSALARYRESRKRKEAELAKAREELRQVLSLRQEAVLVSAGMLN